MFYIDFSKEKRTLVEPIRNKTYIIQIENWLATKSASSEYLRRRNQLIWVIGVSTGLRISDILRLDIDDVRDKTRIIIREMKTGKRKEIPLSNKIIDLLRRYLPYRQQNDIEYTKALFLGKKGARLDRSGAYRLINKACEIVCPDINVGTHTMRKTFGYHHYQKFHDVVLLQRIFNHSAPHITLRYIGITQDQINDSYKNFNLFEETSTKIEPETEVIKPPPKPIKPVVKKEQQRDKKSDSEVIQAIKDYLENNGMRHRDFCEYLLSLAS